MLLRAYGVLDGPVAEGAHRWPMPAQHSPISKHAYQYLPRLRTTGATADESDHYDLLDTAFTFCVGALGISRRGIHQLSKAVNYAHRMLEEYMRLQCIILQLSLKYDDVVRLMTQNSIGDSECKRTCNHVRR